MRTLRVVCLVATLIAAACRGTNPDRAQPDATAARAMREAEGGQGDSYSVREMLQACERQEGVTFLYDEDVARELDRQVSVTHFACFVDEPLERESIIPDSVSMIQPLLWRWREKANSDLMIDRDPLPGTKTYRIYRLPRD